jgi:type II secretory pathway predicted ATPase ExeA
MTQQDQQNSFNFLTPELMHRVELISHLLEHSNHLIIVKGVHESGKSTLHEELSRQQNKNLLIKKLVVNSRTGKNDIFKAVIGDIKDESKNSSYSQSDLNELLERCEKNQQIPVLLIDDVDVFNDELVSVLFEILTESNSVAVLNFCLFCDPLFLDRLKQLGIVDDALDMHIIDMPSLSERQTEQYIHNRYPEDGASETKVFDEKTIQQIHRISHGMPGRINTLCAQYLDDPAKNNSAGESKTLLNTASSLLKTKLIIVTALCLLFLSVGVTFLLLEPSKDEAKKQTIKLSLPEIKKNNNQKISDVDMHVMPESVTTEAVSASEVPEIETDNNNTNIVAVNNEQLQSVVAESDSQLARTVEDSSSVESDTPVHDIEWLSKQDPEKYVLQLIGAYEKDTIKLYLKSFDRNEEQIIAFTTSNKGKDWHVLVYGLYNDRDKALAAIDTLPSRAKLMAPWPRTVGSIKDLLK